MFIRNFNFALLTFSLLAFSLVLAGCLQGGQQNASSIEPAPTIDAQYTGSGDEAGQISVDVSDLEVNESELAVS